MTGNVNIYICSEATENAQPANKQKKPPPAAESSSETTTEPSNASSCKLINRIRSKRRKRQEQESSDFLRSTEDSSDPSNPCSCDSKFSDVAAESASTVCTQETESTLTDCRCKDEDQVQSDRSIESTFVVCDKVEQPCSTIYPTQRSVVSDSEEWSSKSGSGAETVVCDQSRRDFDRAPGPKPDYGGYYVESLKREEDSEKESCRVRKKNVCKCHSGFRSQRRVCRSREPVNTCSCIVEEDEDVCETAEESPEITVCQRPVEQQVCRRSEESEESEEPRVSADLEAQVDGDTLDYEDKRKSVAEEETQVEQQVEDDLDRRPSSVISQKLIRPEALALRRLIQAKRAGLDQTLTAPSPDQEESTSPRAEEKPEPAFLKKFNLRDKDKFLKHLKDVEDSETPEENRVAGGGEEIKEKKTEKKEEDEGGAEEKKGFPGRLKTSLFKTFRRVSGKEKNKNSEDTDKRTSASDKKSEEPDNGVEADQSAKSETEGTRREKKMTLAERLDINKFFKKKEPTDQKKTASKKKNKQSTETDPDSKSNTDEAKEEKQDEDQKDQPKVPEEQETNLSSSPIIASKISVPTPQSSNLEETNALSKDLSRTMDAQDAAEKISPQDIREESKDRKDSEVREEMRPELSKPRILGEMRPELSKPRILGEMRPELSKPRILEEMRPELSKPRILEEMRPELSKPRILEEMRPELSKPRILEDAREARNTEVCPGLKQPSVTVCARHPQRQPASRCTSQEIVIHTVCTNQPLSVCSNVGRSDERIEDSRCTCCCVPAPQSCNRLNSYPKSCLKKERQFCRMESQENNCSVLYRDNRSWEECGCRRIVLCEGCCRPRSECSCRPVPPCVTCYKPKTECICNIVCPQRGSCRRMKSMVCLYCDRPRDGCTCSSPIRKCSCCEMAVDLCCCEPNRKSYHEGRPVAAEPDCDRTMYVTAWKPREDVRRYFSRNLDDLRRDSINECCCHEKPKPQNSDDLPYQRLSCFSDVMNELQRKISESVCCTQCRKVPCCCNLKVDEGRDQRRIKCCVSPKSRRKTVVCPDKPRSKSPTICKCDPQSRGDRQKKTVVCCQCKSSPCRCKKSKSKKPRMKCYYCKNSPCVCIAARERSKPRSCRCADSPCRAKEKEITVCGKTSAKPKNNEEKMICVR
ncbi:uncharacterized protein LOC117222531 [Megalopta genalis]|uniref:uncharacterized protein LOC117222531 n=1 Tax=Megalopta genalis TaxID=115081 RepID=UPI003FD579DB